MGSELRPLVRPDAVSPERQRPRGGDARVLLPQRARGGVARVRCRLLPLVDKSLVQLAKTGERHVHLASHFDQLWRVSTEHAQWDRGDRAQIDGHVLSDLAVAARCSACEHPALVREIDCEAVDLRLEDISDRRAVPEALVDVLGPLLDRLLGCHLLERAHRGEVLNLLEPGRGGRTDPLRGRVGRHELRMRALQLDELVVGSVVSGIVDGRLVEHVVLVQPPVERAAQLGGPRRAQAAPRDGRRSRRRRPACRPSGYGPN